MVQKLLSVLVIVFIAFFRPESASAALIFSDTFSGGYNSSWYVPSCCVAPINSTNGITGLNSTSWSVIEHQLNENLVYRIEFDLIINNSSSTQTWGLGIGDDSNHWKIINTWQSSLQLRENPDLVEKNILFDWNRTQGVRHFELIVSPSKNTNFDVIEDGQNLISWSTSGDFNISRIWLSILGNGDYELANFVLSTYEEPTQTPTPTETPTPSPTATPTPIPTPTEMPTTPQTRKIIMIPGYYNAYNAKLLMSCETGTGTESWTPMPQATQLYAPVMTTLRNAGYTVLPFYYDWRRTPYQNAATLNAFIIANTEPDEKIHILAHSFGGLVSRAYIEQTQENARTDAMLAVGTPFAGTVQSYPAWAGGDLTALPGGPIAKLLVSRFLTSCGRTDRTSQLDALHRYIPSLQQLLPTFDYLRDLETYEPIPVSSMHYQNGWLPNTFFPSPYFGIRMGTYTGTGQKTELKYLITPPNRQEARRGLWPDGKPVKSKTVYSQNGDNTVLQSSATLPDADNSRTDPLSHFALISSKTGIGKIMDFFRLPPPLFVPMIQNAEPESAMMIISDTASIELDYGDGTSARDTEGLLLISNPKSFRRTLRLRPRTDASRFSIGLALKDGRVFWKDYSLRGRSQRQRAIRFNEAAPTSDMLD